MLSLYPKVSRCLRPEQRCGSMRESTSKGRRARGTLSVKSHRASATCAPSLCRGSLPCNKGVASLRAFRFDSETIVRCLAFLLRDAREKAVVFGALECKVPLDESPCRSGGKHWGQSRLASPHARSLSGWLATPVPSLQSSTAAGCCGILLSRCHIESDGIERSQLWRCCHLLSVCRKPLRSGTSEARIWPQRGRRKGQSPLKWLGALLGWEAWHAPGV